MDRVGRPAEGGGQANPATVEPEAGGEPPRRGRKCWGAQAAEKSL